MQCWWEGEKAFFIGKVLPWFSESHFAFLKLWNKKISKTMNKQQQQKETDKKTWRKKMKISTLQNICFSSIVHTRRFDSNFSHNSKSFSKFELPYEDGPRTVMGVK